MQLRQRKRWPARFLLPAAITTSTAAGNTSIFIGFSVVASSEGRDLPVCSRKECTG